MIVILILKIIFFKIRRQWGERYHEWITKAEQKMEELQKVNQLL